MSFEKIEKIIKDSFNYKLKMVRSKNDFYVYQVHVFGVPEQEIDNVKNRIYSLADKINKYENKMIVLSPFVVSEEEIEQI